MATWWEILATWLVCGPGDDAIRTHHALANNAPPGEVIAPVPDRVTCGAGVDKVLDADPSDDIAAACEDVSFRQQAAAP